MPKRMTRLYDNLDEAKAFVLSFTNFVYFYGDRAIKDYSTVVCKECGKSVQTMDYLIPKANCKKPTGILHSLEPGVNQELRDDLIARFDITEADFRPARNKKGEIVYYQITPQHVMLPIYEENAWSQKASCPSCKSIQYEFSQYYNEKGEPYFYISQAALDNMGDLNVTYERFRFYMPDVIVSRRLYDYLIERYPQTHYFPMFLKDRCL